MDRSRISPFYPRVRRPKPRASRALILALKVKALRALKVKALRALKPKAGRQTANLHADKVKQ